MKWPRPAEQEKVGLQCADLAPVLALGCVANVMTPQHWQQLKPIIESALERDPRARGAFLDAACAGDPALRAEAEAYVEAHDRDPDFIEAPAMRAISERTTVIPTPELDLSPGKMVGPYRIVRQIAAGGMGAVYLAVRADDAYQKEVAVKVIRRDPLATPRQRAELLRRFRTERQTLADLDHPNIARLFDGGQTDDGTPYLVMEYIEGRTIDRFCDEHKLTTAKRLDLFRGVCEAVNFAHQKLVIHRDLKPANILVTPSGVPKLLDFGLAKLLDADSSSLAHQLTVTGAQPMTPAYASPEQIRGKPVSTATDVYSLGVVLFELLTGHRPYPIANQPIHEIARRICEDEPERPSTKISRIESTDLPDGNSSTALTPESVSRTRDGRPDRLRRRLRGDVDTIVLKALQKEPDRRYASVEQFGEDIRRHLAGEPIAARPATAGYRANKFIRRHKLGVSAAAIVTFSLVAGIIATTIQTLEAKRQLLRAEQLNSILRDLFKGSEPDGDAPRSQERPQEVLDRVLRNGMNEVQSLEGDPELQARLQNTLGVVNYHLGRMEEARQLQQSALDTRLAVLGENDPHTIISMINLAEVLVQLGQWKEAETLLRRALDLAGASDNLNPRDRLAAQYNLARVLRKLNQFDDADRYFRDALVAAAALGERDPATLAVMNSYGGCLREQNRLPEAEQMLSRAVQLRSEVLGQDHAATLSSLSNLAWVRNAMGKRDEALASYRALYESSIRALGPDDAKTLAFANNYAFCLMRAGQLEQAETIFRTVVQSAADAYPEKHINRALYAGNLGECLVKLGHCDEAEQHLLLAYRALAERLKPAKKPVQKALRRLVEFYEKCGRPDEAAPYRAQLTSVGPPEELD